MTRVARQFPRLATVASATFLLLAGATEAVNAQSRVYIGAGVGADLLVGDASDFLDGGGSRFLMADFRMDRDDRIHIRLDGSRSALEDDEDGLTGATAENDLFMLLGGPQLSREVGRFRPYAAGLVGVAGVRWQTDANMGGDDEDDGSDSAFAWGAHAGLGFTLDRGSHPVALRVEARLVDVGTLPFARAPAPGNTQQPVGILRQDIAVFSLRAAVTLGF